MFKKHTINLSSKDVFAVYSLPGKKNYRLISGSLNHLSSDPTGFIVQKFDKRKNKPWVISPDQILESPRFSYETGELTDYKGTLYSKYIDCTSRTIDAIRTKKFEKVVISRSLIVERNNQSIAATFHDLVRAYPDAFVFLYNIPGEGCWCGASPELLIKDDGQITTTALAGTQPDLGQDLRQVSWGNKEIHEQDIIQRFIEEKLERLSLKFTKKGPVTTRAGKVFHILSTYNICNVPDPLSLADSLHPGPAICGSPYESSIDWIRVNEDRDRMHYCGYLGPWNIDQNNALFVNLRSMRIYRNCYNLFIGGGITASSIAEKEWHETELKASTLLSIINKTVKV